MDKMLPASKTTQTPLEPGKNDAAQELLDTLCHESRRRQRTAKWVTGLGIIAWLMGELHPSLRSPEIRLWGTVIITLLILMLFLRINGRSARRKLAQLAAEQTDNRAVGPLLRMVKAYLPSPDKPMVEALCALLPRIERATDLTLDERDTLAYLLENLHHVEFARAGLATVERTRDSHSLAAVRKFAHSFGIERKYYDIHRMAVNLLPYLEVQQKEDTQHASLLRASMLQPETSDALLRAADSAPARNDPTELLRADSCKCYADDTAIPIAGHKAGQDEYILHQRHHA